MRNFILCLLLLMPISAFAAEWKQWEVRTAPLAFVARWFTFEGLYRINPSWAIGPSYVKYSGGTSGSMFWPSDVGYSAGIVASYYSAPEASETFYGTVRFHHEKFTSYGHNSDYDYSYKGNALTVVAGYRVSFLDHFFMMLGAGASLGLYKRVEIKTTPLTNAVTYTEKTGHLRLLPYVEAKLGAEF